MLAGDNSGRRSGGLIRDCEIELDPGEGFVEADPVDLRRIADALDAGDQFITCPEREIVVQVLVRFRGARVADRAGSGGD